MSDSDSEANESDKNNEAAPSPPPPPQVRNRLLDIKSNILHSKHNLIRVFFKGKSQNNALYYLLRFEGKTN